MCSRHFSCVPLLSFLREASLAEGSVLAVGPGMALALDMQQLQTRLRVWLSREQWESFRGHLGTI